MYTHVLVSINIVIIGVQRQSVQHKDDSKKVHK